MSGMTRCWWRYGLKLALLRSVIVCGVIAYAADCALAQLIPDGTLANNSSVTPLGNTSIINGAGGSLSVTASESVQLIGTTADGQSPSALSTQTQGTGSAGELRINTAQLLVTDGAQLTLSSVGSGEAGELQVTARSIQLENLGAPRATTASGNAGSVNLDTDNLVVTDRNGGNISNSPSEKASIPDVPKPGVPEPSSTLGILAFAAFSAAKVLKRKQRNRQRLHHDTGFH